MVMFDWLIRPIGFLIMVDGIGSIILYWNQKPIEHLVRVLRACGGLILILIG